MGKRQREWARRKRAELIKTLGERCTKCGAVDNLEVDHIIGRDYTLNKLSQDQRISRYTKELALGQLQLLCDNCNRQKGYESQRDGTFIAKKESNPF